MPNELQEYDFLKQSQEAMLRQEARNILSSYSQVHDVLAESLQNAVDAVDERYHAEPGLAISRIAVVFDTLNRTITVTDTGTGITWEMLQNAPAPNITYKRERNNSSAQRSRGEKRVGLSFLTFVSNLLRVKTCNGSETIEAEIRKANDWVHESTHDRPTLHPITTTPGPKTEELGSSKYTQIQLVDVRTEDYCEQDVFSMGLAELIYTLRTKTAIGHTESIVCDNDPEPDVEVSLTYISEEGEVSREVPYKYLSPEEYISEASKLPYERFIELLKRDRLNTARGKALTYRKEVQTPGGRTISCYAFAMAPKAFDDVTKDRELSDGWAPNSWAGIFISTRGMPTGISIEPPTTYSSGYWRRVFMLLEDDEMNFDVGRKSLQGRAKPMMQEVAEEVWKDIYPYLQRLTPADAESVVRIKQAKLNQLFREAENWPDLGLEYVQYLKEPQREQMVVALFYELVGAGVLRGYETLRNNTIDQYDAFVHYSIDKKQIGRLEASHISGPTVEDDIILEFKHNAHSILSDIVQSNKRYQDIDLLVCWELDKDLFETVDITVEPIPPESVYYFGSTHYLFFPGTFEVGGSLAVIELKSHVERVKTAIGGVL